MQLRWEGASVGKAGGCRQGWGRLSWMAGVKGAEGRGLTGADKQNRLVDRSCLLHGSPTPSPVMCCQKRLASPDEARKRPSVTDALCGVRSYISVVSFSFLQECLGDGETKAKKMCLMVFLPNLLDSKAAGGLRGAAAAWKVRRS